MNIDRRFCKKYFHMKNFRFTTLNEKRDVMSHKSIPNVLPDGALKPISHNDLVIAKLNNDSIAKADDLDDKTPKKLDKKV